MGTHSSKLTHQNKLTAEVMNRFSTILGGNQFCHLYHILPHYQQQSHTDKLRKFATFSRSFVTCKQFLTKTFVDNENDFAFSVIKSLQAHSLSQKFSAPDNISGWIVNPNTDSQPSFEHKLFQEFLTLSDEVKHSQTTQRTIEDQSLSPLIRGLVAASPEMPDKHVIELVSRLGDWPSTESTRTPNFKALWNGLDSECVMRCTRWSTEQLLYVAGLWHHLKLSRITKFNGTMLQIIDDRLDELNSDTLIQILFYVNLQRHVSPSFMAAVEEKLSRLVQHLALDQIAVVAMAFFKTKTRMKNHFLIEEIVKKTESGLADASQISLAAVAKSLRYSSAVEYQDLFERLQTSCVPHLSRFTPTLIMHLALLCVSELICSPELLSTMMRKFDKDMDSVRLKELSRSMFCLSLFAPDQCIEYGRKVSDKLLSPERNSELDNYPGVTISLVLSLAYVGIYSPALINKCLDKTFLKSALEKEVIDLQREVFVIDSSVGIECPKYDGNRLSEEAKLLTFNVKHRTQSAMGTHPSKPTHQNRLTADVMNRFSMILGGNHFCHLCHILPHFQQQDLLLTARKSGGFKPIPTSVRRIKPGTIIVPPVNEKWLAIVIGGRAFYNRKSRNHLGPFAMKIRHLKRLGFTVIEIPWFAYDNLHDRQREHALRAKISAFL